MICLRQGRMGSMSYITASTPEGKRIYNLCRFFNQSSPVRFKLFSEKSIFSKFSRYLNNPKKLCFEDDELYVSPLFENSRYLVLDNPLKASLKKTLYDKLEQG